MPMITPEIVISYLKLLNNTEKPSTSYFSVCAYLINILGNKQYVNSSL